MIVASDVSQLAMFHLQLKRVQICSTYCTPEKTFWCFRFGIQKTRWWQLNYFFKNSPRKVGEDEPNFMSMVFRWVGWVVKTHQPEKGAEARRMFSQKIMGSFQWYGGFLKWWYPTTIGFPTKNDHFGVFWGYHHLREHPYEPLKTNGVSTWILDAFQGDFEQLETMMFANVSSPDWMMQHAISWNLWVSMPKVNAAIFCFGDSVRWKRNAAKFPQIN